MMSIALYGKKEKVAIYQSDELLAMQLPVMATGEVATNEELSFNWGKLEKDELPPVDEEVVFDRSKIKTVDRVEK